MACKEKNLFKSKGILLINVIRIDLYSNRYSKIVSDLIFKDLL